MNRPHKEPHVLRCYAYAKGDLVYAECIDLSIIVARHTLDDAFDELKAAIEGTLEVAAEEGILDEILKRKSPWQHRLNYYIAKIRTALRPLRPGPGSGVRPHTISCTVSCPSSA